MSKNCAGLFAGLAILKTQETLPLIYQTVSIAFLHHKVYLRHSPAKLRTIPMDTIQEFMEFAFSPGRLVGHLSYILLIVSMLMRTMTKLRILAVSAGLVSAVYGFFWLNDPVTVFWEVVFVTTNLVQLSILAWENKRASFNEDEQRFIKAAVPNVEKGQAKRLLKAGQWSDAAAGDVLTREGEIASHLVFITSGAVRIEKAGRIVGVCGHDDFVGEISFMNNKPATATAIVANSIRYLKFEREKLRKLVDKETEIRHALETSFNRNLVEKLIKSNEGPMENHEG
jgi:hypothetical protein